MSEDQKTRQERSQYVVMSNDLVRNVQFRLTTQQLKILLYSVSKIKPDDDRDTWYVFELLDLCKCCGIRIQDGGVYYKRLKADIKMMSDREWSTSPDSSEQLMSWIGDAELKRGDGTVRLRFNPFIAEYLFQLRANYTQFELQKILTFNNKHSIRIYMLLKSYIRKALFEKNIPITVEFNKETLQTRMSGEKNTEWKNFRQWVLMPGIAEINKKSDDIHVEVEYIKEQRAHKVSKVRFVITKPGYKQIETAKAEREKVFID